MKLENNLPHQINAINAVCGVFDGVAFAPSADKCKCARIDMSDPAIKRNISAVQNGERYIGEYSLPGYYKKNYKNSDYLNIDVKMETGTGKTYVYTRTMFELHRRYGVNKFMVLVPTVPIKEGVKAFLTSSYMRTDLQSLYGGTQLKLHVLDAQKAQKKGKKMIPGAIEEFANATDINGNRIDVLLINSSMLTSNATMGTSYDQTLLGVYSKPYELLKDIAPFVIIDEPHKFNRENNKTFKCLINNIRPQCVIRYGATFPIMNKGAVDYENVVYNLGACDAFNDNLVKGVEVEYIADEAKLKEQVKIKVLSVTANKGEVKTVRMQNEATKKSYDIVVGQSLSEIDGSLDGIVVDKIDKGVVSLSNGMDLHTSDSIYPQVFGETFQRTMLSLALDRHFEKERANFRRLSRIKTLSLFFIDSIGSFRNGGHLRTEFEELLAEKIRTEIKGLSSSAKDREYKKYLEYSLSHIPDTIAGYFAEDNNTDSDDVKREVDKVLREKDKIIRITDDDGNFQPTRFIFSKWTLKEGWDNPNVFVIAKLRSSGSETSKLQEVGRGLRLPVDEYGNRISDEQMYLRYIIDYSEKDFADKLKKEINGDAGVELKITKDFIEDYAKKKQLGAFRFVSDLVAKKYFDYDNNCIVEENRELFEAEYPDLFKTLRDGKVTDVNNTNIVEKIGVRENVFKRLEGLWKIINQKYYLHFDEVSDDILKAAIFGILKGDIDGSSTMTTQIKRSESDDDGSLLFKNIAGSSLTVKKVLPYSVFLKEAQNRTNVPIKLLHSAFCEYFEKTPVPPDYFSRQTLRRFVDGYRLWFIDYFKERYAYEKIDVEVDDPLFENGELRKAVVRADVGRLPTGKLVGDVVPENYLYDACCYDVSLERENIMWDGNANNAEVEAFAKIPKRTVRIPTYADGTYSPDFMYIIKKKDGSKQLSLVVETKDKDELDPVETRKIACATKLFEKMQGEAENVRFRKQLRGEQMVKIVEDLFE